MARVPVRTSPGVSASAAQFRGARTPVIDAGRMNAPQLTTPQFVTPKLATQTNTPGLRPGITPEGAALAGRQLSNLGQAMVGASGDAQRIILDIQAQANGLVVDDALNKSKEVAMRLAYDKETGFASLKGYDALNRPDGKSLTDEYTGKFDEATREIAKGLKNDAQRQAFAREREQMRLSLIGQTTNHEAAQFREYNLSVQEGTIATSIDEIGLNYNNPEIAGAALTRLKGAVAQQAIGLGKSAAWAEARTKEMTSKAHVTALKGALNDNNLGFADAYISRYADDMTADDLLTFRGLINKEVDLRVAMTVAAEVMGGLAPQMGGETDYSRMKAITAQSESGNRERDAQGNLITSPKGAQGKMQVMPGTNRDPGFGVTPARDGSDAERTRVGNDYLDAMLKRYGGDPAKAWAAYNAGPGRLDEALAKGGNWLANMPRETQQYVTKNVAALGGDGGPARRGKPTLSEAYAALDADPRIAGSPSRLKAARDEVERRFKLAEQETKAAQEKARETAFLWLEDNGGNYAGMPARIRAALDPDDLNNVRAFAKTVGGSASVETDYGLYYALMGDPRVLGNTNLNAYKNKLSDTDFKQLVARQANLRANPTQGTRVQTDKQLIDTRLTGLDIDTSPKPGTKDAAAVGRVWQQYQSRVDMLEEGLGRKATDKEREGVIDRMFMDVPVKSFFGTSTKAAVMLETNDTVAVPAADRTLITAALKRAGKPITEQAIVTAYLTKLKRGGASADGR